MFKKSKELGKAKNRLQKLTNKLNKLKLLIDDKPEDKSPLKDDSKDRVYNLK